MEGSLYPSEILSPSTHSLVPEMAGEADAAVLQLQAELEGTLYQQPGGDASGQYGFAYQYQHGYEASSDAGPAAAEGEGVAAAEGKGTGESSHAPAAPEASEAEPAPAVAPPTPTSSSSSASPEDASAAASVSPAPAAPEHIPIPIPSSLTIPDSHASRPATPLAEEELTPHPEEQHHTLLSLLQLLKRQKPDQEERIFQDQKQRAQLKQSIVVEARKNALLERDLTKFERKFLLRLRERISDEEVLNSFEALDAEDSPIDTELADTLQRYGNLLFFLQQDPDYLVRLFSALRGPDVDVLVGVVVFTLYANPHDMSEEHILLTLIRSLLNNAMEACSDITTFLRDNSAAPKLLSAYTRREPCQALLKQVVSEPLTKLLAQTNLNLEINPRKVFEGMLAEGKKCDGPDAPEVQEIVNNRVNQLLSICDSFLQPIYAAEYPLGFRLICRLLRDVVFRSRLVSPSNAQHIADSLVGGFVFLRFFTPAIVDPRTVRGPNPGIVPSRIRRNTIMVAKVLQNLSNGVLFGDKEPFMKPINAYLQVQMQSIRAFFARMTNIPSLDHFIKAEAYLERTEPFVYISLKEMVFVHKLSLAFIKAVAPNPDDPVHKVLESLKEYSVPAKDLEKYVTLRLVNWMSGTHMSSRPWSNADEADDDQTKRLKSILLPTLTAIARLPSVRHLIRQSEEADADGDGDDSAANAHQQLQNVLNAATQDAQKANNANLVQQIALVASELKHVKAADGSVASTDEARDKSLDTLFHKLGLSVAMRQMMQTKLAGEVVRLNKAMTGIRARHNALRARVNTFKAYIHNPDDPAIRATIEGKGPAAAALPAPEAEGEQEKKEEIRSVLSASGLIGGLLGKLQRDVAERVKEHLVDKPPETLLAPNTDEKSEVESVHFPRTCDFYESALETFSTVGKSCIEDMVLMVLNTLPSMAKVNVAGDSQRSQTYETNFSWGAFLSLVPNLKVTNPAHLDLLDCVVDQMAVDILTAVLQHLDGSTRLHKTTVDKLIQLAFLHFQVKGARKLRKSLWMGVRSLIRDQWAVLLGQLCPFHLRPVVSTYRQLFFPSAPATGSKDKVEVPKGENAVEMTRGVRYLRFDTSNGLDDLEQYIDLQMELLEQHKKKKEVAVERAAVDALRHCVASLDFTILEGKPAAAAPMLARMADLFNKKILKLYELALARAQANDEMKLACRQLAGSIIMRAPHSFFEKHSQDFLIHKLCKGVSGDKARRVAEIRVILQFLRGGAGDMQVQRVKYQNGQLIDHVSEVFGPAGMNRLSPEALDAMHKKLFIKKAFGKVPELRRLFERMIVQMAFHDWTYATSTGTLAHFTSSKGLEQLIGLRALEIMLDERSGFAEFLARGSGSTSGARVRVSEQLSSLARAMVPGVLDILRECDKQVGLKALGTAGTILLPGQHDEEGGDEMTEEAQLSLLAVDQYDLRLEQVVQDSSKLTSQRVYVEAYCQALRLLPKVVPAQLLEATPDNCTLGGLFIGKLLVHKERVIARCAFEALGRTVLSCPAERVSVITGFLHLLADEGFQDPSSIATLLLHLNALIEMWIERLNVEGIPAATLKDAKHAPRTHSPLMEGKAGGYQRLRSVASDAEDRLNPPSWLSWQSGADAIALLCAGYPSVPVRRAALHLLRLVQAMNRTWHRVNTLASGVITSDAYTPLPLPNAARPSTIHCVADVLDAFGEDIIKTGVRAAADASLAEQPSVDVQAIAAKPTPDWQQLLTASPLDVIAHCVAALTRQCVRLRRDDTTGLMRGYLSRLLRKLPPSAGAFPLTPSDEVKSYGMGLQEKFTFYHALYLSSLGVTAPLGETPEDRQERKDATAKIHHQLDEYLKGFWEPVLSSDLTWVRDATVSAASAIHFQSAARFLASLDAALKSLQLKKRKKATPFVAQIISKMALAPEFSKSLLVGGRETVSLVVTFIEETHNFLWTPRRLLKQKWLDGQLDLVKLVANFAAALDNVKVAGPNPVFDENGALVDWSIEQRYTLFKWMLQYTKNAHIPAASPAEQKEAEECTRLARHHCCLALKALGGLGKLVPDEHIATLLKEDLLGQLLDLDQQGYMLLSVMLCWHFKYLFPVYLDKVYSAPKSIGELYFRGVAELFARDRGRLTTMQKNPSIVDVIDPDRLKLGTWTQLAAFARQNLGKIVHLGLLQMTSANEHTRFNAFLLVQTVTKEFISAELGRKLLDYRFAFESHIGDWARQYALIISEMLAAAMPSISFQVFREACVCLRAGVHLEWVTEFLLPWAGHIALSPLPGLTAVNENDTKVDPSLYACGNLHASLNFLSQLFALSVGDKVPILLMLPLYRRMARLGGNVAAILEFMVQRVADKGVDSVALCKTIMFSLYSEAAHRDRVLLTITRYLLRVLQQNIDQMSKSNLKTRLRGSQILSVLEKHDHELGQTAGGFSIAHDFKEYDSDDAALEKEKEGMHGHGHGHGDSSGGGTVLSATAPSPSHSGTATPGSDSPASRSPSGSASTGSIRRSLQAQTLPRGFTMSAHASASASSSSPPTPTSATATADDAAGGGAGSEDKSVSARPDDESSGPSLALAMGLTTDLFDDSDEAEAKRAKLRRTATAAPLDLNEGEMPRPVAKKIEQAQSNLVAAMLVELIGVDTQPVLPYFPVILIYAVLHLNDKNEFVRRTMHKLLTRLMSAFGDPEDTSSGAGADSSSVAIKGPLLADALRSESLQLLWTPTGNSKAVSSKNTVVMFATSFIAQFCDDFERRSPNSIARIGYEALRWAILSTKLSISKMAHTIYRSLLRPLNEASLHALTMSLLGALEDWERQNWYTTSKPKRQGTGTGTGTGTGAGKLTAIKEHEPLVVAEAGDDDDDLLQQVAGNSAKVAAREAEIIMDTLKAVADKLLEEERLHQHPSLFWTAVALLRCDAPNIYDRALDLLLCMRGYPYLYRSVAAGASPLADLFSAMPGATTAGGASHPVMRAAAVSVMGAGPAAASPTAGAGLGADAPLVSLPEDFWLFAESWSPRFEGVQPYLLPGLLNPRTEPTSLILLGSMLRVVWDPIVDSSQTRYLTMVLGLLPWLYEQIRKEQANVQVREVLYDMASVIGGFSRELSQILQDAVSYTKDQADLFLRRVCMELCDAYFPQYAQACGEYLTALMESESDGYHPVVLKITNQFLQHQNALTWVNRFDTIISIAHETLTKIVGADSADVPGRRQRASMGPSISGSVGSHKETPRSVSEHDLELAAPSADLVSTVIALFNRANSPKPERKGHRGHTRTASHLSLDFGRRLTGSAVSLDDDEDRGRAGSGAGSSGFISVRCMPIRSLRNAINALQQVVRSSPMFPK